MHFLDRDCLLKLSVTPVIAAGAIDYDRHSPTCDEKSHYSVAQRAKIRIEFENPAPKLAFKIEMIGYQTEGLYTRLSQRLRVQRSM